MPPAQKFLLLYNISDDTNILLDLTARIFKICCEYFNFYLTDAGDIGGYFDWFNCGSNSILLKNISEWRKYLDVEEIVDIWPENFLVANLFC